jgi:antitoxin (DNA-binding transcriptional repressor) of toxin-antitoxin stability system
MRSVNIAELKNRLSTYIGYAKAGEEIIIRDRKMPVARLVPLEAGDATEHELRLIAEGKLIPAKRKLTPEALEEFWKMPRPTVKGKSATQALLDDREEGW